MARRGEAAWGPEEAARFFAAYHQHGQDWDKVAEAVGGEVGPAACEALFRRQQAYLSIPQALQSGQAFAAMVENMQQEGGSGEPSARSGSLGSGASGQHGEGDEGDEGEGRGLAGARSRRTPRRSSPGGRASARHTTPVSGAKRGRSGGRGDSDEDGEEVSGSARKRRAARQRLDFAPQGGRRRLDADAEAKGIDALLALAVAGEESGMALGSDDEGGAPARARKPPKPRGRRRPPADEDEDWEEGGEDAGALEDDEDEDFAPPRRRTPHSTPARARLARPASAHATPRRSGSRGVGASGLAAASPGMGLRGLSPYMLAGGLEGGELLGELGGLADLGYITSPGFQHFAPGFVPSPQNPMPRLRRRKSAPERTAPGASPVKTLFARRASLAGGPPLMAPFGFSPGGEGGAATAAAPQSAAEARLAHCLQQPRTQRWAAAEFLYSALDRPFFLFDPLAGLLAQLGLGDGAALTRREWSLIRSGLGKPRRLSLRFLKEERARLERWREGCRQQYAGGAAAADAKVARHLPWALGVGQRVVARHPATRQLADGAVLTAAHNCYRVQFDRQELGVELVRDTDLMPAHPADNLPPALLASRPHLLLNGRVAVGGQPVRQLAARRAPALPTPALTPAAAAAGGAATPSPAVGPLLPAPDGCDAPGGSGDAQPGRGPRAGDVKTLAELAVGLDKKEALVQQLRGMNDEAAAGVHGGSGGAPAASGPAASQPFVNAYASVLLQIKDVNEGLQAGLEQLERRGSGAGASAGASPAGGAAASPAADAALQAQLQAQTPEAFAAAALEQARDIIATCRSKLAESAAAEGEGVAAAPPDAASQAVAPAAGGASQQTQQQQQQQQVVSDGAAPAAPQGWGTADEQRLDGLIEGCVHSLVVLLRGAQGGAGLAPATLSAALDGALAAVQPHAAANRQLFQQIQEAVRGLKSQISAAS